MPPVHATESPIRKDFIWLMTNAAANFAANSVVGALLVPSLAFAAEPDPGQRPTATAAEDVEVVRPTRIEATALRRQLQLARTPQPVEILVGDDLETSPARTVADRLRYVPGIDVYQLRHGQFEVGLRGYNGPLNNRLLVMVDDRMYRIEELGVAPWIGTIFASDLSRIEVAKGPSSVTYGANAFGGVVSMRSRPVGDQPQLFVSGGAGSPTAWDGDATALGPLYGPTYFKASVGYTRLDDLPTIDSGIAHQASPRTSATGRTDLDAERSNFLVGVRLPWSHRLEGSWYRTDHHPWEIVDGIATGVGKVETENNTVQAALRSPWYDLSLSRQWLVSDYQNQRPIYAPALDFAYLQFGFKDVRDTARVSSLIESGRHRLTLGAEVMEWTSRSNLWDRRGTYGERSTWAEVRTFNRAIFAEEQFQVAEPVTLTAGARGDDHSKVGARASPRAAINWVPDAEQFVLLSYSSGYRQPTGLELFQSDYFLQPNDGLGSETIHAVELQWKRTGDDGLDWTIGGFFNRSNHLIWRLPLSYDQQVANFQNWLAAGAPASQAPGPVFQYENLNNPVRVWGAEIAARLRLPGTGCALWSNATWQHFRYEHAIRFSSPGLTVPVPGGPTFYKYDVTLPRDVNGPPPWKVNAGIDWEHDGWFATIAGRAVGPRHVYDLGHSIYIQNTFVAEQKLDSYYTCDLSLGWRLGRGANRFIRLAVLDLFDSSHHEHYETTRAQLQSSGEDQLTSTVGRQFSVVLGWAY